jgi:hypothetical protein
VRSRERSDSSRLPLANFEQLTNRLGSCSSVFKCKSPYGRGAGRSVATLGAVYFHSQRPEKIGWQLFRTNGFEFANRWKFGKASIDKVSGRVQSQRVRHSLVPLKAILLTSVKPDG